MENLKHQTWWYLPLWAKAILLVVCKDVLPYPADLQCQIFPGITAEATLLEEEEHNSPPPGERALNLRSLGRASWEDWNDLSQESRQASWMKSHSFHSAHLPLSNGIRVSLCHLLSVKEEGQGLSLSAQQCKWLAQPVACANGLVHSACFPLHTATKMNQSLSSSGCSRPRDAL